MNGDMVTRLLSIPLLPLSKYLVLLLYIPTSEPPFPCYTLRGRVVSLRLFAYFTYFPKMVLPCYETTFLLEYGTVYFAKIRLLLSAL